MTGRRAVLAVTAAALIAAAPIALAGCSSTSAARRLPPAFPSSVPVVPGAVLGAEHDAVEWHVWIAAADPVRTYSLARRQLLHGGYSETADSESPGGSDGQFCDPTWCVGITGYRDPEHGPSVMCVVARTSGMGPPQPLAGA